MQSVIFKFIFLYIKVASRLKIYTTIQKFGEGKGLKEVSYANQGCIYLIKI